MRFRGTFFATLLVAGLFVLPHLAQASIPNFDPIIEDSFNRCAAGWGAVMIVINNIIEVAITILIVFVAPLMLSYAGFLMVINQGNGEKLSEAKKILTNTVVGIVIALSAWMIIDAIMVALYNGPPGTWSSLISSKGMDPCLIQEGALKDLKQAGLRPGITGVSADGGVVNIDGKSLALCSNSNPACSPSALQQAGFTQTQSKIMSCIAVTESSGNPSLPPYNIANPGSNSTACGTFQITKTTWETAASGACADFSNCTNATCNAQVAQTLVAKNGYSDWTCAGCNTKAASCVQQYGS